jgi:hypothetical protein
VKVDEIVKKNPLITPAAATAGINTLAGKVTER